MTELDHTKMQMVNPHKRHSSSLLSMCESLIRHKQLIFQMTKREVVGRYKGSIFGLAWSFFNPVFMLIVYTLVFSVIFKSRWGYTGADESKVQFALVLFAGLIVLSLFNEVIVRSPSIITSQVNLVKKVVFPLEVLPVVVVCAALFHFLISLSVLLIAFILMNGYVSWTVIFMPIVFLPLIIFSIGLAWILAAIGVFLRDINQTMGMLGTVLMFLSPVFYPLSAVPENLRLLIMANPLSFIIEQSRDVIIFGNTPNFIGLAAYIAISLFFSLLGYVFFQLTRKGFADVL